MAADLEKLAQHFNGDKFKNLRNSLNAQAGIARQLGAPESFAETSRDEAAEVNETSSKIDLRQKTYELLSLVREPTEEEKEALGKRGIVFLPIETKSLSQVVSEDQGYFWSGEQEYVDSRKELKEYTPPVPLQVGLNPENPAISGSLNKPKKEQLEMIEKQSQELQDEFPDARLVMLPSTVYAQADKAYKKRTDEVFFKNIFARALDQTSGVYSADVGRNHSDRKLSVSGWSASYGHGHVGAVPAVVFLRK